MVRDISLKTDRLLTLVPLNRNCSLTACPSTKDILNNLFLALQHPYICPVFHVDFLEYEDQTYIVLVQPINQGSLKDLVYGVSTSWHRNVFSSSEEWRSMHINFILALLDRSETNFCLFFCLKKSFIRYHFPPKQNRKSK